MAIEFTACVAHPCEVGQPLSCGGRNWSCIMPCTVIGFDIDKVPVVKLSDVPRLALKEFLPAGMLRTPGKPGQTRTQVLALGKYEKVVPEALKGMPIKAVLSTCEVLLIVGEDDTYTKTVAREEFGETFLDAASLSMRDLRKLKLISETCYANFQAEKAVARAEDSRQTAVKNLKQIVFRLGADTVRELL